MKTIKITKKVSFAFLTSLLLLVWFLISSKQKPKDALKDDEADDVLNDTVLTRDASWYKRQALDIAHHLGTAYSWWDYHNWTENDNEAFAVVSQLTPLELDVVSDLYALVYAQGQDLRADLARLLPQELYVQLNNI